MPSYKSLIAMLGALAVVNTASSTIIDLSDASSDETDAGLLSGTMDFEVLGNVLTLTVTNNTADPSAYQINELYFNVPDGVTLSFDGLAGWSDAANAMAGGFGTFDFALLDGQGGSPNQITAGETVEFTFTITAGSPDKDAFVSLLSDPVGDGSGWIVAAKFAGGPDDDSAFGAAVPAPGVLALLGAAGLVGSRRRRRRA
jgi:hypothetical protein